MSLEITSPMPQSKAADYLARVCQVAVSVALAILNTATVVGRVALTNQRVTVIAQPSLEGWQYRVCQAIG